VALAKGRKLPGLRANSLCPEERSFDWKNVAVARRKALRGWFLPATR